MRARAAEGAKRYATARRREVGIALGPQPLPERRSQGNHQRTRFLIGLPKTAKFEVFSLTNPNRVVIEVDGDEAPAARAA